MSIITLIIDKVFKIAATITLGTISLAMAGFNPVTFYVGFSNQPVLPVPSVPEEYQIDTTEIASISIAELDEAELVCLQKNIYFEARNQSYESMQAVALVTMNRVGSRFYPDTVCGVVFQGRMSDGKVLRNQCQFSWTCDGKGDDPKLLNNKEIMAWNNAYEIATNILSGNTENFLGTDVTHYHANYVKPKWSKASYRYVASATIQSHIFYKDKQESI